MIFKSKEKKLTRGEKVIINDHPVKEVNYTKYLGLYFDENVSWKYHISDQAFWPRLDIIYLSKRFKCYT